MGVEKGSTQWNFGIRCGSLFAFALLCGLAPLGAAQQDSSVASSDRLIAGDTEPVPDVLPPAATKAEREKVAWSMLSGAVEDEKHPTTRVLALAALGLVRTPRSENMIVRAMKDQDVDVRTAAALAAGQTHDPVMTSPLRDLLDDREPQVAFIAAVTLWKMADHSGEDILMAIVDGNRTASPTLLHGTEHKISKDLHDPGMLARLGAEQGASMLLGPFGFGIAAYEYLRKSGGDPARVTAIEELSQETTRPVHKELLEALDDKDPAVRAASAKALATYRDSATSQAVFALVGDPKYPVRLTAAAAYLRTTGVPGPRAEPVRLRRAPN
jgi:HEAT repeat protein